VVDAELIQIVDAALADAARKSGAWLVCRPGCTECCYGPFDISEADADRLLRGMEELPPERAALIRARAQTDDEACPVLDPVNGTCELYAYRPITCRVFGPPMRVGEDAVGICELCYHGATDEEIAACEVELDIDTGEDVATIRDTLRVK
jgi:Fe-S-cluster containining protein